MNVGWKLFKGEKTPEEAASPDVDDSSWESVNLPNGIELLPEEASGCSNYQGPVWYRKTFIPPSRLEGRRNTLYFEGIMGKSEVWVNGEKAAEHFGGYLPVIVNLDKWLKPGQKNVIAVKADNSNDASYPPGKPQEGLDFFLFWRYLPGCVPHFHRTRVYHGPERGRNCGRRGSFFPDGIS